MKVMDAIRNPYVPGAGSPPSAIVGREGVLSEADIALSRIGLTMSTRSIILVGLRGVGKTVLLVKMDQMAKEKGYKSFLIEANENKPLSDLIIPSVRKVLFSLSTIESAKEKARQGLRVFKSFLGGLKISYEGMDVTLGVDSELGCADSGILEDDLAELFCVIGEAAQSAGTAVTVLIDELQYLNEEEMSALIMSSHRINQRKLPIMFIGAGLPQILSLAGDSKSYAERLFKYPQIGALEMEDAKRAIVQPANEEGVFYTDEAVDEILNITERYPYFLQQWGHEAWNLAEGNTINIEDVRNASIASIRQLDEGFFRVRFDRCTPSEKKYLRALADFGPGNHRSGDIADVLGVKITSVAPTRSKLIKKGMIYSFQHGETAFTVPMFDSYMRRVMPDSIAA